MFLSRTTAPAETLTLAEAKAHLRVDNDDGDSYIESLIEVALTYLDGPLGATGQCLGAQEWAYSFKAQGAEGVRVPIVPATSIESITYYDPAGDEQAATVGDFLLLARSDRTDIMPLEGKAWSATYDRPDAITVTLGAGVGLPANVRHAALLLVGFMHENRGATPADAPPAVQILVNQTRIGWVG